MALQKYHLVRPIILLSGLYFEPGVATGTEGNAATTDAGDGSAQRRSGGGSSLSASWLRARAIVAATDTTAARRGEEDTRECFRTRCTERDFDGDAMRFAVDAA